MEIFRAIKNFFYDEEPEPELVPASTKFKIVTGAEAADLFQVPVSNGVDFMNEAVGRARVRDAIKDEISAELTARAMKMKEALDQGRSFAQDPDPAPETAGAGTDRPSWQTVSDDL